MGCEHCGSELAFAFHHKGYQVWWCRFCAEHFFEEGGHQYLLNPGRVSEARLPERRAG